MPTMVAAQMVEVADQEHMLTVAVLLNMKEV
jgi:hypothetical protein